MKFLPKLSQKPKRRTDSKKGRMLILHKRQITVMSLLILIGVAGYLNWNFQQDAIDPDVAQVYSEVSKKLGEAQMVNSTPSDLPVSEPVNETVQNPIVSSNGYFAQAKLERDVKRSESMDMLTKILDAQDTGKEARAKAEDEVHRLADATEKEAMIENIIRAKGYEDVVVFIGETLISIAVKSEGLNEVDAAVLRDAAMSTTGYPAEHVKIVEINS